MKITTKPAVTVVTVVEEEKIILELSPLEAHTLGAIMGGIGKEMFENFLRNHRQCRFNASLENHAPELQHDIYNKLNVLIGNKPF
jgi:hypothetical protein